LEYYIIFVSLDKFPISQQLIDSIPYVIALVSELWRITASSVVESVFSETLETEMEADELIQLVWCFL